jgi:predicted amidohydrolase
MAILQDIKVTVASLHSVLISPQRNLALVKQACEYAHKTGAKLLLLPELMLTGHGGHQKMIENAEKVPEGPLSSEIVKMSKTYSLCICTGIAEIDNNIVYNSQMVADRGRYLGIQRKINLSGDEYSYFRAGESVRVFDTGDIRFGITICYDNHFPELGLIHSINNVDLILAPHAARDGKWEKNPSSKFCMQRINARQENWEMIHRAMAYHSNAYILLCNAVGSSTEGIEGVEANHTGTVMGIDPNGEVFLRTAKTDFTDELATVELKKGKRKINHSPAQNRRLYTVLHLLSETIRSTSG